MNPSSVASFSDSWLVLSLVMQEVAEAFSTYCGISIIHSLMYKKVVDAQHRSKLSNELMMYHMKVRLRISHRGEAE